MELLSSRATDLNLAETVENTNVQRFSTQKAVHVKIPSFHNSSTFIFANVDLNGQH